MRTTTPKNSTAIKGAWYSPSTRILTVQFKNDKGYLYSGVPNAIFTRFQKSNSKGRYFAKHIRNVYPSQRDVFSVAADAAIRTANSIG